MEALEVVAANSSQGVNAADGAHKGEVCIAVRNLTFWYDRSKKLKEEGKAQKEEKARKEEKNKTLKNVSLDIYRHQVTALIGPSGCGKSTFLRTLNRMNELIPDTRLEGAITFDGKDLYARDMDVVGLRKRIGMVFQKPNPFPMSIADNIMYGPRLHGQRDRSRLKAIVEQTLQQAALWDEVKDGLHKSAFELSGGQQQRLCIARVLSVNPEVILLDEPCSALDPNSTESIEELIQSLKSKYTLVIVTHNLPQAKRVSERTALFWDGKMVECGSTEQIFQHPKEEKTKDYVSGRRG